MILKIFKKIFTNEDILPKLNDWPRFQQKDKHRNTMFKITIAQDQHNQALQNFNYADRHHIDKSIRELNSAKDRLTLLLMQAIREVQDRA